MRSFFLLQILLMGLEIAAQQPGRIRGTVSAAPGSSLSPLQGATVALLPANDTVAIQSTTVGREGMYTLEGVQPGTYKIMITAVGYKKAVSAPLVCHGGETVAPPLLMTPLAGTMGAVTVTARRPPVEHKLDRTIVNVDASITNGGTNILEVLEKSPGIIVDKDGGISMKGKEGVLVMIDGRPTQLGGTDLVQLLQQMPSSQVDQVELMTNPPARYDAAGNAGIINIKTKKNTALGYNGSFSLGFMQGRYPKTTASANLNYRVGKVNIYANGGHSFRRQFETLNIDRRLRETGSGDILNYFEQEAHKITQGYGLNGKLGMDYFLNTKTTLGFSLTAARSENDHDNHSISHIATATKEPQSRTEATVAERSTWDNFGGNINFRKVLGTGGRELTADADYIRYRSGNTQLMINRYFDAAGGSQQQPDTLQGALPQEIAVRSARIDYLHPFKKEARFEAGIKASLVETDNNARYDSLLRGSIVPDLRRSNHFVYGENVYAAYVNLSMPLSKKWSAQGGLRMEHTVSEGRQVTSHTAFSNRYTQLFPTAYLQYRASEKHSFVLNYGRRIRRPNYESLNPFVRFIDRYTYHEGNPTLQPQSSDNIELTHSFKNFLTTTINYSYTTNIIQTVMEQEGEETYVRQANLASLRQWGISFSSNVPVMKWWTSNTYVNIFNNRFSGEVVQTPITISATRLMLTTTQQFRLLKELSAELSIGYRTAGLEGVARIRPVAMAAAGLSHPLFKGKGTIRLNVRDMFQSLNFRVDARYAHVDASFRQVRDSRMAALSFSYRFSKGKLNPQRKKQGSAGEEQERIGMD